MEYSLQEIHDAMANAKAAGDTKAWNTLLQLAQHTAMQNAPAEKLDPTEGNSFGKNLQIGIGQGLMNVGRHAGNLVGLVPDQSIADAKGIDAPVLNTGGGKIGSFIGETAASAPLAMGATGLLARGGAGLATALSNPITRGAVEGATQGFVMGDPGHRTESGIMGGALGAAVPAAFKVGGKLVNGITRTPEAQRLLDAGIDLTPGQMNPNGPINALEEAWQSVPVVGSAIKGARDNAQSTFQRAAIQEGAAPGAQVAGGDVHEMLDAAYKSFAPLYDQAKGFPVSAQVVKTTQNVPLSGLLKQAANTSSVRADDATRKSVSKWLSNQLTKFDGTSDSLLDIRSAIRTEARNAALGDEHAAAALLGKAQSAITDSLESQLPKDALQALQTADSKYGTYKILEDAVARGKDQATGFSTAQFSQAVKAATDKGNYARGGGTLRDLASDANTIFSSRSPPTGQRLAAIALPSAAGALAPAVGVPVGAGLLGLTATQTGRRLAAGATNPQKLVQAMLSKASPSTANGQLTHDLLAEYLRRASVTAALPKE